MRFLHIPMGTYNPSPFEDMGQQATSLSPSDVKQDDVVVLWGGADIHTSYYNEPNVASYVDMTPSKRDIIEAAMFKRAVEVGAAVLGICRGAQLACALSGGRLYQHVEHPGAHKLRTNTGDIVVTNSVHHQLMRPDGTNHELIAWAVTDDEQPISEVHIAGDGDVPAVIEPEIVWFKDTRALGIQGHPEFLHNGHEFVKYCRSLVDQYVLNS
jgi:gamma-glutamyl-gamma-aminobutyrate hydrolase PuuD